MPRGLPALAARSNNLRAAVVVLGEAGAGGIGHAEFDHRRATALVRRLAERRDRFGGLAVGGIGAAELIQRAARAARRGPAEFDRGGDIGGGDLRDAADIRRLVRIGRIGGEPVAQHQIGGLRQRHGTGDIELRSDQTGDRDKREGCEAAGHGDRACD